MGGAIGSAAGAEGVKFRAVLSYYILARLSLMYITISNITIHHQTMSKKSAHTMGLAFYVQAYNMHTFFSRPQPYVVSSPRNSKHNRCITLSS